MEIDVPLTEFNLSDNKNTNTLEETERRPESARKENETLPASARESVDVVHDRDKLVNETETEISADKKRKRKHRHSRRKSYKTMEESLDLPEKAPMEDRIDDAGVDQIKRIDYVLVYPDKHPEEETSKKKRFELERNFTNRKKFEGEMREEGVEFQKQKYKENIFVKIHVPFKRLCEEAEKCNLEMPLTGCEIYDDGPKNIWERFEEKHLKTDDEVDFVSAPFQLDKIHLFEGHENEDTFFRPALRSYLTHHILINIDIRRKAEEEEDSLAKKGLPYLLMKKTYTDSFLLHEKSEEDPIVHELIEIRQKEGLLSDEAAEKMKTTEVDPDPRKKMNHTWTKIQKYQPLWRIRNYFGEKIGFYFAWSGQLITSLWIPTVFGICIFFYGLYLSIKRNIAQNSMAVNTTSTPLLNGTTPAPDELAVVTFSDLLVAKLSEILDVIKESFDNVVTPWFSLIICLWGTIFLESWKRKNAVLAYEWDVDSFEYTEPDRAEFYGLKTRPDPVTNEDTWYYPIWRQFLKFLLSGSVLIMMVTIVLISVGAVVVYRVIISVDYCDTMAGWQCLAASTIASAVLNAVSILILGKFYDVLAVKFTDWENHRTKTSYDNALIIKLFAFSFANSYASCFYIAFFRGNIKTLFANGILGLGAKYVDVCSGDDGTNCMSMLSLQVLVLMIAKTLPKLLTDIILPWGKSLWRKGKICPCCRKNKIHASMMETDIYDPNEYIERERLKPELEDFTLSEYTEKVIQYGYLMLFSASLPLAPLIALLTNLIDASVDAKRMIWWYRRPVAYISQDIGMWYGILEFVNICGVVSNAFLIAFTSSYGRNNFPLLSQKLWFIIGFENLVVAVRMTAAWCIPDSPELLINSRREKYQVARIMESGDDKELGVLRKFARKTDSDAKSANQNGSDFGLRKRSRSCTSTSQNEGNKPNNKGSSVNVINETSNQMLAPNDNEKSSREKRHRKKSKGSGEDQGIPKSVRSPKRHRQKDEPAAEAQKVSLELSEDSEDFHNNEFAPRSQFNRRGSEPQTAHVFRAIGEMNDDGEIQILPIDPPPPSPRRPRRLKTLAHGDGPTSLMPLHTPLVEEKGEKDGTSNY
ncbi:anoctamin-7-like isoform X3 [Lineus longissimus]|uniref:anoctamin-7-like isoform X3 n=1 Tax=Lineus longissimus TaxID=88925 RepID=UPI00315C67D8